MGVTVLAPLALFVGLGGVVAYFAGAVGLRQTRRLQRVGVGAQALVRYRASDPGNRGGRALLQFVTADDAVMEVFSPVPAAPSQPLTEGEYVSISYDPADPRDIVVRGRERAWLDHAFQAFGAGAVLLAMVLFLLVP